MTFFKDTNSKFIEKYYYFYLKAYDGGIYFCKIPTANVVLYEKDNLESPYAIASHDDYRVSPTNSWDHGRNYDNREYNKYENMIYRQTIASQGIILDWYWTVDRLNVFLPNGSIERKIGNVDVLKLNKQLYDNNK